MCRFLYEITKCTYSEYRFRPFSKKKGSAEAVWMESCTLASWTDDCWSTEEARSLDEC